MPEETSTGASGETPNAAVPPVTGTTHTPSPGETPGKTAAEELEEFKAKVAALEKSQANAKDELERHRKNAKKLADYEQKEQAAREAAQSDVEKANSRAQAAEAQIQQYKTQLVQAQVKMAAKDKNIIDPDLAALAIQGDLELDKDTGLPTNLDEVLDKLIKNKPYLVAKPAEPVAPSTTPAAPNVPNAPALPAMNPGRPGFAPANQGTPSKPMTLADIQWKR